jgi:predicted  nucleic acid-binding Zn-ribbon protein
MTQALYAHMNNKRKKINKDMETLKNNQSEINKSISKIKISIKSLTNRVEQVKNNQEWKTK